MAGNQDSLRAALAVSALNDEERIWLESRLSDSERASLTRALDSLDDRPLPEQAAEVAQLSRAGWETRMGALLATIMAEPTWMLPFIGHALGPELCGKVLNAAEGSVTWRARTDTLRRTWSFSTDREAPALRAALLLELEKQVMARPDEPITSPPVVRASWRGAAWLRWLRHE